MLFLHLDNSFVLHCHIFDLTHVCACLCPNNLYQQGMVREVKPGGVKVPNALSAHSLLLSMFIAVRKVITEGYAGMHLNMFIIRSLSSLGLWKLDLKWTLLNEISIRKSF